MNGDRPISDTCPRSSWEGSRVIIDDYAAWLRAQPEGSSTACRHRNVRPQVNGPLGTGVCIGCHALVAELHPQARTPAECVVDGIAHPWNVLQSVAVAIAPAAPLAEIAKLLDSMQVLGRIVYGELPPSMVSVLRAVLLERRRKAGLQLKRLESDLRKLDSLLTLPLFDQVQQPEAAPASAAAAAPELGAQLFDQLLAGALALREEGVHRGAMRLRRETLHQLTGGEEEPA